MIILNRRKKRRYVINDDLIVFDLQTRCELGYVKNICRGGLAFEYFNVGKIMLALGEFGLLDCREKFAISKLPYRIVNIASGELNDNAAMKYDLEAWFPASNTYRELVSCSNCLDYQARKLKVRIGKVGSTQKKDTAHTLNCTAIATSRTICCILENYQNKDGTVSVPKVLQKYMNGKKFINS